MMVTSILIWRFQKLTLILKLMASSILRMHAKSLVI